MNLEDKLEATGESISEMMQNIEAVKGPKVMRMANVLLSTKQINGVLYQYGNFLSGCDDQEFALVKFGEAHRMIELLMYALAKDALIASGVDKKDMMDVLPQLEDIMHRLTTMSKELNK